MFRGREKKLAGGLVGLILLLGSAGAAELVDPVWFVGTQRQGLEQTSGGTLVSGNQPLPVRLGGNPKLYAAADYRLPSGMEYLIAVTDQAEVLFYGGRGTEGQLQELKRLPRPVKARPESVRFTRIPGLLYLTWTDLEHEARMKAPLPNGLSRIPQECAYRDERLVLCPGAEAWHAIPLNDKKENLLQGSYQIVDSLQLELWFPDGRKVTFHLPDPIETRNPSAGYWEINQVVFYSPGRDSACPPEAGRGVLCLTKSKWVVYGLDGTLINSFSIEGIWRWGWGTPIYDGLYYRVSASPIGPTYRLDLTDGKMIRVER